MKHLKGLIAAPFTPFRTKGGLDLPMVEKLAASLVANKVSGAFVCGTTGEGVSMTTAERMKVAARWQACAGEKLRVIVHVGHTSLGDSRAASSAICTSIFRRVSETMSRRPLPPLSSSGA